MTRKDTPVKDKKIGAVTRAKKQQKQDIDVAHVPVTAPETYLVGKRLLKRQATSPTALGATTPAKKKNKKSDALSPQIALDKGKEVDGVAACASPEAKQVTTAPLSLSLSSEEDGKAQRHQVENPSSQIATPPPVKRLRTLVNSPDQPCQTTIVGKTSARDADEGVDVPVQHVDDAPRNGPFRKPEPASAENVNAPISSTFPALWTPIQRCVSEYAASKGHCAWEDVRSTALQITLDHLIHALKAGPPVDPPLPNLSGTAYQPPLHATAAVSYIMPTESHQVGADSFQPLPHLAIRPPGLEDLPKSDPLVAAALEVLRAAPTTAAIFPLREENKMKEYLLFSDTRLKIIEELGGKIEHAYSGTRALHSLLQDRTFVCLHYMLGKESSDSSYKLQPCPSPAASNVQLGIMVRRGVGGTCPMKAAARKESVRGPLSALLDDAPELQAAPTTISSSIGGDGKGIEVDDEAVPTHQKISFSTLSCRLELYIDEQTWKGLDRRTQCVLFSSVRHLEQEIARQLAKHSWERLLHCCRDLQARIGRNKINSDLASIILPHITSEWMPETDYVRLHIAYCSNMPSEDTILAAEAQKITVRLEVVHMGRKKENGSSTQSTHPGAPSILQQGLNNKIPAVQGLPPGVVLVPVMLPGHARPVLVPMRVAQQPGQPPAQSPPPPTAQAAARCPPSQSSNKPFKLQGSSILDLPTAVVLTAACLSAAGQGCGAGISMPWPYYSIGTRDSFTHHLVPVTSEVVTPTGKSFIKTEWFFKASEAPVDYERVLKNASLPGGCANGRIPNQSTATYDGDNDDNTDAIVAAVVEGMVCSVGASESNINAKNEISCLLPVGVTTYNELLSHQQLSAIEQKADIMDMDARHGKLPSECFHTTRSKGGSLKRTKFFFGARYLWTREQLAGPDAHVAMGVRADVPHLSERATSWMKDLVEAPLVDSSVLPPSWIDSIALNMYHDGSEGIQSHFDDSQRFHQPIYSLRLFSDSRLSFGTQLYGYTNGAFCIPMPRGCVTVMEAGGYAANGVKHCVRPSDMAGKSAGMILRRINPVAMEAARRYAVTECTEWMKCLSLNASLRPVPPIQLGGATGNNLAQRALRLATGKQHRPASMTLQKQVSRVMDSMLERVEGAVRKEKSDATAAALCLLGMVRKVESAERIEIDLSSSDAALVFSVLDDIVSFCERPAASMQQEQRNRRTLKRKRPLQSIMQGGLRGNSASDNVAAVMQSMVSGIELAEYLEQQEIRRVLSGAVMAVDACCRWQNKDENKASIAPCCPTYEAFAYVLHLPAVGLLRLAQSVAAAVLLGGTLAASSNSLQVHAGVHAAVMGCNLHSTAELRCALLAAIKWTPGQAAPDYSSAPPPLSVVQFQMAVSIVYRALCVVSMNASGTGARLASLGREKNMS